MKSRVGAGGHTGFHPRGNWRLWSEWACDWVCCGMNSPARRTCRHCRQQFLPDYRNTYHQRFCSTAECQHASKRLSQRRWLLKPVNRNYFREPDNAERVREWRLAHPGYWRTTRDPCTQKRVVEPPQPPLLSTANTSSHLRTLKDFCRSKTPVLSGLISRLNRCALQEDIARWAREVLLEAQCILDQCQSKPGVMTGAGQAVDYHETG